MNSFRAQVWKKMSNFSEEEESIEQIFGGSNSNEVFGSFEVKSGPKLGEADKLWSYLVGDNVRKR